jgi:hypothetical protein
MSGTVSAAIVEGRIVDGSRPSEGPFIEYTFDVVVTLGTDGEAAPLTGSFRVEQSAVERARP